MSNHDDPVAAGADDVGAPPGTDIEAAIAARAEPLARAVDLAEELRTVAGQYLAVLHEVERCATYMADVDRRLQAARHQAGDYRVVPLTRELAADLLHHAARELAPYVPAVSDAAAERAEGLLRRPMSEAEKSPHRCS